MQGQTISTNYVQCRVHEMHNILTNLLQLTHGEYENNAISL